MIQKFQTYLAAYGEARNVYLHLPDNYYETGERYPVIYMFDGHNLFEDSSATYGKSWGLETFLNGYDKPFIMVGIECSHKGTERLNEYCPYNLSVWGKEIRGRGDGFLHWLVHEFKPMIDRDYRTIPFRECTAIGGSSMGGLMAYYALMKHNRWFSKAACLSPSIVICKDKLFREFEQEQISPDTRCYFSAGTEEMDDGEAALAPFAEDLRKRGAQVMVDIIEGGRHHESTWETRNPVYMDFLWKN